MKARQKQTGAVVKIIDGDIKVNSGTIVLDRSNDHSDSTIAIGIDDEVVYVIKTEHLRNFITNSDD